MYTFVTIQDIIKTFITITRAWGRFEITLLKCLRNKTKNGLGLEIYMMVIVNVMVNSLKYFQFKAGRK